jgi:hypothetical protein
MTEYGENIIPVKKSDLLTPTEKMQRLKYMKQ